MKVLCEVEEVVLVSDSGRDIEGLCVRCGRCDHEVEVYGTSGASIRRGLVMLRDECPEDGNNFYVCDDEDS